MNRKLGRPFTFNELIIVLSAAMLLGVLLLPAHHLLRPLKENAACSANLKQLTVNAMNYAADNNNMMIEYRPSTTKDVGKDNWVWNMVRQGYIQPKHLFCETITQYTKYSLSQPAYAAELEAMDNTKFCSPTHLRKNRAEPVSSALICVTMSGQKFMNGTQEELISPGLMVMCHS